MSMLLLLGIPPKLIFLMFGGVLDVDGDGDVDLEAKSELKNCTRSFWSSAPGFHGSW